MVPVNLHQIHKLALLAMELGRFFQGVIDGWSSLNFEEKNAKLRSETTRNPVFLAEAVRLIRRQRHEEL